MTKPAARFFHLIHDNAALAIGRDLADGLATRLSRKRL